MKQLTAAVYALFANVAFAGAMPIKEVPDFAAASAKVRPAVVKVQSTLSPGATPAGTSDEDFFAIPEHHGFASSGSGFIIGSDGVVLTNHHVIENAATIRVHLADRRSFSARLIGSDPASDVAVLKIAATGLPVIEFGDSNALQPGQWVLAIGSPFEMDFSVTAGIVSAKGRSLGPEQRFVPFLQTDVPINRGNSGGPLLDLEGRVVGMNSAIFSQHGGFVGLSFAIPAATVSDVTSQIREHGSVRRGFLGVGYQDLSPELASALGLTEISGALLNQIQPESAAAAAGLRQGDVVLAVAGTRVLAAADLPPLVGAFKPGQTVKLQVHREGQAREFAIELGEAPAPRQQRRSPQLESAPDLELTEAEPAERDLLRTDRALMVTKAGPHTMAHGLRRGDAILAVLGQSKLPAAGELQQQLRGMPASAPALALLVRRGPQLLFVGWSTADDQATLH